MVRFPITDRIEWKHGVPLSKALWIIASPYITPGLEPDEHKSFLLFSEISP